MPLVSPQSLARTYSPSPGVDAWEHLQLYRQTERYDKDWGSQRVATAITRDDELDFGTVTRSQIRVWVDEDGKPDAARGLDIAEEHGWLADDWTPTARAFAALVIGIHACGSIGVGGWRPSWTPGGELTRAQLADALEQVGVGVRTVPRSGDPRPDELRARGHGSVLGRALAAAGAPTGTKTEESVAGLPDWLETAPPTVRAAAAELLVRERGAKHPEGETRRIGTERPLEFFEDVAALIADVTGEPVTASETGVTISADAVRKLGVA